MLVLFWRYDVLWYCEDTSHIYRIVKIVKTSRLTLLIVSRDSLLYYLVVSVGVLIGHLRAACVY